MVAVAAGVEEGAGAVLGAQAAAPAGDPVTGKALFLGARRLSRGAPSCRACHSVAGIGALGGGNLGPDLTGASTKFGREGLATILSAMPFPTMRPVYGNRGLTAQEQADLLAFLEEVRPRRQGPVLVRLAGLVLVGGVILLGLTHVVWRGRLRAVRTTLVKGR